MRSSIAIALLVSSAPAVATAQETPARNNRYLLLATERTRTMQQEIDEAASQGFRVVTANRTSGGEVLVLLERTKDHVQYRLLATARTGTLQREIAEAAGEGYRVVPHAVTTKGDEVLVLMQKLPEGSAIASYQVLATERTGTLQKEISQASLDGYRLVAFTSGSENVAVFEKELATIERNTATQ
jgi:hypothetical protein